MARITIPMETTLGAHAAPARIALRAKSLGLAVTHEQVGGWFHKSHLVTATGDEVAARVFWEWAQSVLKQYAGA